MKMSNKEKFEMLHRMTLNIINYHEIYSSSYEYVENHLNTPAVDKAFQKLETELKKQLDKLRKEAKK